MANTLEKDKKYYLIKEETRDRLVTIVEQVFAMAAFDAHDETETEEYRALSNRVAQGLLDILGELRYAEGGLWTGK